MPSCAGQEREFGSEFGQTKMECQCDRRFGCLVYLALQYRKSRSGWLRTKPTD